MKTCMNSKCLLSNSCQLYKNSLSGVKGCHLRPSYSPRKVGKVLTCDHFIKAAIKQ